MTTSHILTDEEIDDLQLCLATRSDIRDIEAAVIAKLSDRSVMPEPAYQRLSDLQSGIDRYYTADQMREAFAQGAASQLSAEPAAWLVCALSLSNSEWRGGWAFWDGPNKPQVNNPEYCAFEPLYTRKEPT